MGDVRRSVERNLPRLAVVLDDGELAAGLFGDLLHRLPRLRFHHRDGVDHYALRTGLGNNAACLVLHVRAGRSVGHEKDQLRRRLHVERHFKRGLPDRAPHQLGFLDQFRKRSTDGRAAVRKRSPKHRA